MSDQMQADTMNGANGQHFWGFGRLLAISCLLQIVLIAIAGFWGVFYLALTALLVMWFCTAFRAIEQPDLPEILFVQPSVNKIIT